jgi:multiple sugar transport system substrate-binding protein
MIPGRRLLVLRHGAALALLALAAACAGGFAGSRNTQAPETAAFQTATLPVASVTSIPEASLKNLTIEAWHPWFGVEASLFESEVEDFNQTNPWGIRVRAVGRNSYTELYDVVTTALPTAERPQLVIGLPEYAIGWDHEGYVADLLPYMDDPMYGLTAEEIRDFPRVFLAQDNLAGKQLGMPAERGAQLLVYNSTWAHELGYATAPKTPAEFRLQSCAAHRRSVLDQVRSNDAEGGWLIDTSAQTLLSWMMAFGGGVLEGSGYHFLTPKNLEAITYIKQVYDDGCAWVAHDASDSPSAFADRRALFATASLEELPGFSRAMAAANNADDWTVLSFPGQDQDGLAIYGSSFIVLRSTPQQQLAAWLFTRWLLLPEHQQNWVEVTGLFPLRNSALGLLDDYRASHPQWSAAVDLIPRGQIQPQLASWKQVRIMVGDGFDAMFRTNTPAGRVAEVLAIMEKTASDLSK